MAAMFAVCAVAIVLVIVCGVKDCRKQARCTDNGGTVERFNCGPVCMLDPNTNVVTCYEDCDWRCVGANPEAR